MAQPKNQQCPECKAMFSATGLPLHRLKKHNCTLSAPTSSGSQAPSSSSSAQRPKAPSPKPTPQTPSESSPDFDPLDFL